MLFQIIGSMLPLLAIITKFSTYYPNNTGYSKVKFALFIPVLVNLIALAVFGWVEKSDNADMCRLFVIGEFDLIASLCSSIKVLLCVSTVFFGCLKSRIISKVL